MNRDFRIASCSDYSARILCKLPVAREVKLTVYLSIRWIDDQDIVATKPTFKTIPTPLVIMNMVAAVARLGLRQARPSVWLTTARRLPYWCISVVSGSRVLSTMVPRPLTAASKGPSPSGNYLIAAFHLRKACLGSGLRFIRRRGQVVRWFLR